MDDERATFDPDDLRRFLSNFPTGVTVVAAAPEGVNAGMTVGSFFSISLDPPLVGFCAGKGSSSWPDIERAGSFAVSILGRDQAELSNHFASSEGDRFHGIGWYPGTTGSPVIDGAVAHLECVTEQTVESGDHWIVIGRVVSVEVHSDDLPLVFFRRSYGTFEPVI